MSVLRGWGARTPFVAGLACATMVLAACGTGGVLGDAGVSGLFGLRGVSGSLRAMAAPHQPPAAPDGLRILTATGQPVPANAWTNHGDLQLSVTLASPQQGVTLQPEVEFRPADEAFAGSPNVVGQPGAQNVPVPAMASGRQYHWQVRAREVGGDTGPWTAFDGVIGYVTTPPAAPEIAPLPRDGFVAQPDLRIEWMADGGPAGVVGFAYTVSRQPDAELPALPNIAEPAAALAIPEDGDWYFRVRTLDGAGNWSEPATAALHVDTVPLAVRDVVYRTFAYYPGYGTLPISFKLTKPADVTVAILPAGADTPVRTFAQDEPRDQVKVEWDGRDEAGAVVPPGRYRFRVTASDEVGNSTEAVYDRLLVTQKRIVISLSRQALTAYDGDRVAVQTLVTTGGPELPTPIGTFQILAKFSPFTFHSPWPKSSPYWYPDSPTSYAMLFEDGGYFIHDAPWRSYFGPGSNASVGQPGGNNTGTHGCVNVPFGVQARLFAWADPGTPVVVTW